MENRSRPDAWAWNSDNTKKINYKDLKPAIFNANWATPQKKVIEDILPLKKNENTVGTKVVDTKSKAKFKVTKSDKNGREVQYCAPKNKKLKTIKIPDCIRINGVTYKVTSVSKEAFKNNKYLQKVTIGKYVKKIDTIAFYGCKKLKKITIKSKSLKKVGKNAIKNINKKAYIDVPKSKVKAYKKLFKSNTGYKKSMKLK